MKIKLFLTAFIVNIIMSLPVSAIEVIELKDSIVLEKPIFFENKEVVIKAGSQIIIKGNYEHAIHIKNGILRINGTSKTPVIINTETDKIKEGEDINAFFLEDSEGYISHAHFKNNVWALHIHFSNMVVKNCLFENNYGGIRLTAGSITIEQNLFIDNDIAIRFLNSSPKIQKNIFTYNNTAIFIREGVENTTIENNGFFKNKYDLYAGFFQTRDISATNNFFLDEPKIFDAKIDPDLKANIITVPMINQFPDWH